MLRIKIKIFRRKNSDNFTFFIFTPDNVFFHFFKCETDLYNLIDDNNDENELNFRISFIKETALLTNSEQIEENIEVMMEETALNNFLLYFKNKDICPIESELIKNIGLDVLFQ